MGDQGEVGMMVLAHKKWCVGEWHDTRDECTCGIAFSNLALCLRDAGALCAAFDLGALFGGQWMARDPVYPTFEPGCQSKAPSGESLAALQQKVKDALTACGWPSPVCRNAGGGR